MRTDRRAAVLGSPVDHSLSPVLHNAAYAALGLPDWTYDRIECDEARLPGLVASMGPEWAGLSVTMPGKLAALRFATTATPRAVAVGAANTLIHRPDGTWHADCTDIDGVTGALLAAGGYVRRPGATALVLGAGGTARAALAALVDLDVELATLIVRDPARAAAAVAGAARLGLQVAVQAWSTTDFAALASSSAVVINTAPAAATAPLATELAKAPCLLDVIYHPWPTPVAEAVTAAGGRLATGLDMLLHQAFTQVEHFTGLTAPRTAMRDALHAATGGMLPLPL
ncbi:shikimate dehydrogenase [Actinokineospora alba]|uniref:Shikimate dehydrogenase n=1 Tax=Actinokineospora alba TaxID=504798 RepID=A0A1H0TM13_9PSEU|nr:shikimate dehydrogenase [Actinokineospora alba]TDP70580.1 shikimate dehydrogenase [Actinokineospora alba]SDJ10894.1 shikimate dehydrogenase [Actinokineospora alba]SDP54678.1 shikimate dehydrogenase [Actinokineospora alba]